MQVKLPFFPLSNYLTNTDKEKLNLDINKLLNKGSYILGDNVFKFERAFSKLVNAKYSIGVGNGFDALKLALKVYDFPENSEVLVPTNTFIATPLAVSDCNLKFIPVDVDNQSMNICFDDLRSKINEKSVAIIAVHLFGNPVDLDKLKSIASKYNLKIIEDCSQAHGSEYKGKKIGSSGNICCFSLYPTKNLGAFGDAGVITTNSITLYKKLLTLRNYGSKLKYHHDLKGVNSRLDEIQALFLNIRLRSFKKELSIKRKYADIYLRELNSEKFILPKIENHSLSSWHLFIIKTKQRKKLMSYLEKKGIQAIIHYPIPCHKQKCYSELNSLKLKVSEQMAKDILSIPLNHSMSLDDVQYVVRILNEF